MRAAPTRSVRVSATELAVGALLVLAPPAARAQALPAPAHAPRVRILNPEPAATLTGRNVPVVLEVQGVALAASFRRRPGTAHCVLFLDRDLTSPDVAVPDSGGGIAHLRRGQLWHTFEGSRPGPHRLIAVLVGPNDVPLEPLVADTVQFTLKPRP